MPTLGVLIDVPDPWGPQLLAHRRGFGDRLAETVPTHVTLVPPIDVPDDVVDAFEAHLAGVAADAEPYAVHLRGTGTFRPVSPVVFVTVSEGVAGCELVQKAISAGPVTIDPAFPYHPHVTVAQELEDDRLDEAYDALADFECAFDVDCFWLYEKDGPGWHRRRRFELGARPGRTR